MRWAFNAEEYNRLGRNCDQPWRWEPLDVSMHQAIIYLHVDVEEREEFRLPLTTRSWTALDLARNGSITDRVPGATTQRLTEQRAGYRYQLGRCRADGYKSLTRTTRLYASHNSATLSYALIRPHKRSPRIRACKHGRPFQRASAAIAEDAKITATWHQGHNIFLRNYGSTYAPTTLKRAVHCHSWKEISLPYYFAYWKGESLLGTGAMWNPMETRNPVQMRRSSSYRFSFPSLNRTTSISSFLHKEGAALWQGSGQLQSQRILFRKSY